jgi:phosphoglycerate dehydrogenase-like enzyme
LDCINEPEALSGYGGTVIFDADKLSTNSRRILQETEILITEPVVLAAILETEANLAQLQTLPKLQWCQSTYAGVDPLFRLLEERQQRASDSTSGGNDTTTITTETNFPTFHLTRFAGKFGPPIAEWCLARMIAHERNFAMSTTDQKNKVWAQSRQVTEYRYLSDLTLTILGGCGDIGSCIGQTAQAFGMKVVAYARTTVDRSTHPGCGWDEVTTSLSTALQQGDYIVSVLPSTPLTRNILSNDALRVASVANGGKAPVFLNVGRGDVITETCLIRALDQGYISQAILDVFSVEPLPPSSPLWEREDVIISPHVSGITRATDVPALFLDNYSRYQQSITKLKYVVHWSKGY